jgi:hypothetical protein
MRRGDSVTYDSSSRGKNRNRHSEWRADITICGLRTRKRSRNKAAMFIWIETMKGLKMDKEKLDWQGWNEKCGFNKVEYFNQEKISCKCVIPCENCGFHYLDDQGNELESVDHQIEGVSPLCGVW